ncbi:MAG: 30S ribosomal protein S20 [Oscillospiraceae bacterium]|nr:30S ribosomal protein S20 [Oscillospiraceae bacterium]
MVTTPNIKSAKKRVSVIAKKTQKNKMARSSLKTTVKKARLAADNGTADEALAAYADAQKALDKAVSRGLLHKNTAARRKSRLQRKIPKT